MYVKILFLFSILEVLAYINILYPQVTHHLNKTFLLNTAIAKLHEYVSELKVFVLLHFFIIVNDCI